MPITLYHTHYSIHPSPTHYTPPPTPCTLIGLAHNVIYRSQFDCGKNPADLDSLHILKRMQITIHFNILFQLSISLSHTLAHNGDLSQHDCGLRQLKIRKGIQINIKTYSLQCHGIQALLVIYLYFILIFYLCLNVITNT